MLSVSTITANGLSVAEESAVNVDVDATLFIQLVLFVLLLLVLKPLLFDPMLQLFAAREAKIEGTKEKASKLDKKSAKALAEYESVLAGARAEGSAERDRLRAEGAKKEAELLGQVRLATTQSLDAGRGTISKEAEAARAQLHRDAIALGRELASRVLGREVSS
jgi:F-type H+-transporting ATPase subunit b